MRQKKKRTWKGRGLFALVAGGAGALFAYFLDPDRGKARRATSKDQVAASVRRTRDQASRRARYAGGRATGVGHRLSGGGDTVPEDDHTLEQKVRSRVLGKERWRGVPVNVTAAKGVVELHGELRRPEDIKDLESDVRELSGVHDVANYLHLPGTPAPNKQEALRVS